MKVISREQFMKMPAGTIWSYYTPGCCTGMHVKTNTPRENDIDFTMVDLIGQVGFDDNGQFFENEEKLEAGESVSLCVDVSGREAMFDEEVQYLVYEKADVELLVDVIMGKTKWD